jgi:DNA-binding HxlR family transcriptional regulator
MRRKSFHKMLCPIARSLERVGEWWSMLIMRDALYGMTRFDQFQTSLGIAPNMLTRRLNSLVEAGLLERRRYREHPPRYEYLPTARGRDFFPVLVALLNFGNKHFASDGKRVVIAERKTGTAVDPVLVDATTGRPIVDPDYALAAGPTANRRLKQKYAAIAEARRETKHSRGSHG